MVVGVYGRIDGSFVVFGAGVGLMEGWGCSDESVFVVDGDG